MTEEEAKTKWCPFTAGAKKFDKGVTWDRTPNCIGSACMAWRWATMGGDVIEADIKHLSKPKGEVNPPFSNNPEGYTVRSHDSHGQYTTRRDTIVGHAPGTGYCGLAGAPQ